MYIGKLILKRKDNCFEAGFCVLKKDFQNLAKLSDQLHPDEHKHYETLGFERRKISYLLGRIAAKQAVSKLIGKGFSSISFLVTFGVFQFPVVKYVSNQNIQVSISHCGNQGIALAFPEEHPLGIDIEKVDENKIATMRALMIDREYALIDEYSLDQALGATLLWTIKEALSKVLRTGLTADFKIFEIESLKKEGVLYISTFSFLSQYKAISKKIDNYMYTVVLPKKTTCDLSSLWRAIAASNKDNE